MRYIILSLVITVFMLSLISYAMFVNQKTMYAPSIESTKKVLSLGNDEFLIGGNTKSFTETSDDWMILKTNSNFDVLKSFVISGAFSDKFVDFDKIESKIVVIGDTWSFRRESLDDILVAVLNNELNLEKYYVVSGTRDDKSAKIVKLSRDLYFLGYTKSAGFGANSVLIYKFDKDFYPESFWVIGSSVDLEPFDLIELAPKKFLLVSNYQKIRGNKDCLLAVVNDDFTISRAFGFGGGFDENIVDIIKSKDNFYFIFETRSFKPIEKTNILISSFNRSNLNHVRSFAFGTLEEEKYLSSYQVGNNIYIFFSTYIDKNPILAVAILDSNLGLIGTYNINSLLNIDRRVSAFKMLNDSLWVGDIFNVNTLEDVTLFKTNQGIFDYLSKESSKKQNQLENLKVNKYYLRVARYPNLESYPVELKSQKIPRENFIITNEINLNYLEIELRESSK
ncbi:MAG: hypothetical protein ACK4GJ_03370 [bacterium]